MKSRHALSALLALGLLAGAGCRKSDAGLPLNMEYNGVKVEWPKLESAFTNCEPEAQASAYLAKRFIRYSQFPKALVELDKLAADSKLTPAQKQVVNDLLEQTRQALAKAPPPPQ
jgi:hypothetical protein